MHFLDHVILPTHVAAGCSRKQVDQAVEAALKRYWTQDGANDDGWWDWYEIGGRFDGSVKALTPLPRPPSSGLIQRFFPPKAPTNVAPAEDLVSAWSEETAPFVVVTPDGTAHGDDDWSKEEFSTWSQRFKELVGRHKGHLVAGVDCHA